jgi:outer membrane biosynthesis protein TonB
MGPVEQQRQEWINQPAVEVSMDDKLKFGALVMGGYLLGRTRSLKLALLIATAVAGNKLRDQSSRAALAGGLGGVKDSVMSAPEVKRLTDEVTGKLMVAGRTAALAAAEKGISSINSVLESQTERLRSIQPLDALPTDEAEEPPAEEEEEPPPEEESEKPAKAANKSASRSKPRTKKDEAEAGGDKKPTRSTRSSGERASSSRGSASTRSSKPRTRKASTSRSAS